MPTYLFKELFLNVTNEQLVATVNNHILFKTYNKITITQLGTCKVIIEYKNIKPHVNSGMDRHYWACQILMPSN